MSMSIIFVADCQLNTYICGREKHHYDNKFVHISGKEVVLVPPLFLFILPSLLFTPKIIIFA